MRVRFAPKADNQADISGCSLCANSGLVQRSKRLLGGDVGATGIDGAHLVAADAAVNNFRAGEPCTEWPCIVQAHQPDGETGTVLRPQSAQPGPRRPERSEGVEETPARGRIVNGVAGQHDLVAARTRTRITFCSGSACTASTRPRLLRRECGSLLTLILSITRAVQLKKAGCDGVQLTFFDFAADLEFFGSEVLPLMKQAGLRV
jgi:hypothetical protein